MLFNSLEFTVFFLIVYSAYLFLEHRRQNFLLLLASLIFYGAWNVHFLGLLLISIVTDFSLAIKIHNTASSFRKKLFLYFSLFINLGILIFFKYYYFLQGNLNYLLHFSHLQLPELPFQIILPVGISFYTFQSLSYTLDVYRGNLVPIRRIDDYALFVSFFPQLVAGPIERANRLLPQIQQPRKLDWDQFYEGWQLIFFGLFKKIFIADNLASQVNQVFNAMGPYEGAKVLLALYAFAFQIYCDFSGYSDIARGLAKVMGFELMVNFNMPYFSKSPSEFWKRWHISLSTWLKDYLYISLGGNRGTLLKTCRNLCLTMVLGGLWHGASWPFVLWGFYHALLLIIQRVYNTYAPTSTQPRNSWASILQIIFFFHLTCFGWLLFRCQSFSQVVSMTQSLLFSFKITPDLMPVFNTLIFYAGPLIIYEVFKFYRQDIRLVPIASTWGKAFVYIICFYLTLIYGAMDGKEFIYFQF